MATTFQRNAETEFKAKLYLSAGLSAVLPITLMTKDPNDDATVLRLMAAINDQATWAKALDILLGPKTASAK